MTEQFFGPLVASWNVEQAIIATYREWMPTYLAAVERYNGLANKALLRPAADSYYGSLDFVTAPDVSLPSVIVVVNPTEAPELSAVGYSQAYAVRIGCVVEGESESQTLMRASLYGTAATLMAQKGALAGLAEDTVLTSAPLMEFAEGERRTLARSVTGFTVYVANIIERFVGPAGETIADSPEFHEEPEAAPEERPHVTKTNLTIKAEDM